MKSPIKGRKIILDERTFFDAALRKFKRIVAESDVLNEYRNRQEFIKPSMVKKRAKAAAKKRQQHKDQANSKPPRKY
jgi:small subunit ribosomal protein S21